MTPTTAKLAREIKAGETVLAEDPWFVESVVVNRDGDVDLVRLVVTYGADRRVKVQGQM